MKITHRRLITFALLLSNIMAGMDGTIVNTALPAITSDLHGLQYTGWIVATFLFGMSVATPFWSKLGEHKGNRWAYVAATTLFALGAILQAQAPSIIWFIAARTVMGIGAGGMNTIPFIVFAHLYPNLKQRSQVVGLASACFGTASIVGPLLGGWIVDNLTWHWVFYVNLPVAAIAIAIIGLIYRSLQPQAAGRPFDFGGGLLLISGLAWILFGIQLIGQLTFGVVGVMLGVGVICLLLMYRLDQRAVDPIIPSRLFTNRELMVDLLLFVMIWGSFIAFITYIPMWAQGILGLSALVGGLTQIPGAATNFIGSELVPYVQHKISKYGLVLIGALTILLAFAGLLLGGQQTPFWLLLILGAFEGFGVGMVFNVLQVSVQTDVALPDVPIATSLAYLVRILSQTLMSAVYGVILNLALVRGVAGHPQINLKMLNQLSNAKTAAQLPATELPLLRQILYTGYHHIVVAAFALICSAVVILLILVRRQRLGKQGASLPES